MSNDAVVVDFIHKVVEVEFDKDITMAATQLMEAATAAAASAVRAETWAEGTDEQVGVLGGEHSAKSWATISGSSANAAHDSEVAAAGSASAAAGSASAAAQSAAEATGITYLVRKNSTAYAEGVVAFYQTVPSPLVLECTTPGATASVAPDFSGAQEDDTITDGTVVWTYKSLLSGSGGSDEAADINMTGYVKPGSYTPVSASDNVLIAIGKIEARPAGVLPQIMVTAPTGCTVTAANDGTTLTAVESSGTYEFDVPNFGDWTVTCAKTIDDTPHSTTKVISVLEVRRYEVDMSYAVRYGFRISKTESDPSARVEYIYDAVGMTPAHMDFTQGVFRYGDWQNVWFVTGNKPLMLKSDGTVDYYLNPNNYTLKEDGTASDVANTSYDGNAMASIPLCYVKRYEDEEYEYEIVSDMPLTSDYKAYAHTRADGSIAEVFYWSMFGGSGNSTKIRSLADVTLAASLTVANEIAGCSANGTGWSTHSWSQYQLLRTLCTLMGKSTDVQAVFGNGNMRGGPNAATLRAGTLKDKGQFYGTTSNTAQVKVFHIEKLWGDSGDRIMGLIYNGKLYVKMTPEGDGYRVNDTTGYTDTGIVVSGTSGGYISSGNMSENGFLPINCSGAATTYYADTCYYATSALCYGIVGGSGASGASMGGIFCFDISRATTYTYSYYGCGLSCEQPAQS